MTHELLCKLAVLRAAEVYLRAAGLYDEADIARQVADFADGGVHWPPRTTLTLHLLCWREGTV